MLTDAVRLVQGGLVVILLYIALLYVIDRRALRTELGALRRRHLTTV